MNLPTRHNPLDMLDDDGDVPAVPPQRKPMLPREEAERIARSQGFAPTAPAHPPVSAPTAVDVQPSAPAALATPARQQRRYTTGRNRQINIKATEATIERFHLMADELGLPLGLVLDLALDALQKQKKR